MQSSCEWGLADIEICRYTLQFARHSVNDGTKAQHLLHEYFTDPPQHLSRLTKDQIEFLYVALNRFVDEAGSVRDSVDMIECADSEEEEESE